MRSDQPVYVCTNCGVSNRVTRRWRDGTKVERYEPDVIIALADAIDYLYNAAYPHVSSTSSSTVGAGKAGAGYTNQETPDRARRGLRKQLDAIEQRLRDITKEALEKADGTWVPVSDWYCEQCQRGHRRWEQFCSRCGAPRPIRQVDREEPHGQENGSAGNQAEPSRAKGSEGADGGRRRDDARAPGCCVGSDRPAAG